MAALLAETQLLLLDAASLDESTLAGLRRIEQLVLRMRSIMSGSAAQRPDRA